MVFLLVWSRLIWIRPVPFRDVGDNRWKELAVPIRFSFAGLEAALLILIFSLICRKQFVNFGLGWSVAVVFAATLYTARRSVCVQSVCPAVQTEVGIAQSQGRGHDRRIVVFGLEVFFHFFQNHELPFNFTQLFVSPVYILQVRVRLLTDSHRILGGLVIF